MTNVPKITVLMPSYNKAAYIAQAIDSVLMQETNFNFELIIIDDKSTDESLKIARKYQTNYPELIRIIANKKNEGCLSTTLTGYEQLKAEYFCVLDPDDYWIGKNKLQNAIDFLDMNSDFTMYISNTYVEEGKIRTPYFTILKNRNCSFGRLQNLIWGHTSGVIFRNVIFKYGVPKLLYQQIKTKRESCFEGDSFRNIVHLKEGRAHCTNNIESVYRVTGDGIWTSYSKFQQNATNAAFFLTMFSYFGNLNPDFFITKCLTYCKKNLEIIKDMSNQKENKTISIKDLSDFYEILAQYLKYQSAFLPDSSELYECFVFYLPSRIVGGYEFLFIRLASFLADKMHLEVYYVDYEDGFAKSQLAETNVKFLKYCKENTIIDLGKPFYLIAPITMSSEIPKLKNPKSKFIFWCAHPKSIKWLSYRSGLRGKTLNNFLLKLYKAHSVCFMDWACWNAARNDSSINFKEVYVPVFTTEKEIAYSDISLVNHKDINVGWLGRLDSDKIFSLINVLDNLYNLETNKKRNIHIIGDGDNKASIDVKKYSDQINIIFASTLINEQLNKYLQENVDILFGMGISVLEAASLRIPSVLVFLTDDIMHSNDFLWLFDSQKYTLGYYKEQKNSVSVKTTPFNEIIDSIYLTNKKEELGLRCYNYFMQNHNINITVGTMFCFISNVNCGQSIQAALYNRLLRKIKRVIYKTGVDRAISRIMGLIQN